MNPDDSTASGNAGSPPADGGRSSPVARSSFGRRHWGKLTLLTLIGAPLLAVFIWAGIALNYSYSNGTRTGYVQKLSRKGWLCKTWEGELAMATAPGVSPQIFTFSIRSDSLAEALTADMGRGRVAVSYAEHPGVPTSCFGDTPYFVTGYRVIADDGKPAVP